MNCWEKKIDPGTRFFYLIQFETAFFKKEFKKE